MKIQLRFLCAAILGVAASRDSFAGTTETALTFDDLSPGSGSGSYINIPNGYGNLQWLGFGVLNGSLITPASGYNNGIVSPNNVAFNDDEYDRTATIRHRLVPLAPRLTEAERQAHRSFVATLGAGAIWLQYEPPPQAAVSA